MNATSDRTRYPIVFFIEFVVRRVAITLFVHLAPCWSSVQIIFVTLFFITVLTFAKGALIAATVHFDLFMFNASVTKM